MDVGAIVAAMDLNLVRMLRGAMRAADCQGAGGGAICPTIQPRVHIHPEPVIEARWVHHPDPRILPRMVIHPTAAVGSPACAPPADPEPQSRLNNPIQAPWEVLPWQNPPKPAPQIKIIVRPPDIQSKGGMLDMFV